MKLEKFAAALTALTVVVVSSAAGAQTVVRIPRITNQKQAAPPTRTGNASFTYVGTPTLRKQAMESYLARVGKNKPERAQMLAADFARTDPNAFYQGLISKTGLSNYDVADAMTAYNLTGWIIANNVKTLPPRSQILAVRRQVAASLASNPRLANRANWGPVGEDFKLMTVTLNLGLLSARRSGDTKAYSDEIATLFAETGPNPRSLVLTNAGLGPKR